tara:strand:+ start:2787 stop:3887 length:1101 start_codon:yes stop_codon:yes gene_type:complete
MSDVRLVGTSPEDGSLVPVAVTPAGLLKTQVGTIEEIPNNLRVDGDLTVTGTINGDQGGSGLPSPIGSDGEVLTVVDGNAAWAAPSGAPGPPGPEGPTGGAFPLPADPYEGALLGWLNGELAWVGAPPVPIPDNVFGPITAWSSGDGLLTVDGSIPDSVVNGVYLTQTDQSGTPVNPARQWNVAKSWTSCLADYQAFSGYSGANSFDGNPGTQALATANYSMVGLGIENVTTVQVYYHSGSSSTWTFYASANQGDSESVTGDNSYMQANPVTLHVNGKLESLEFNFNGEQHGGVYKILVDGLELVDESIGAAKCRVTSVPSSSTLLVVPSTSENFSVGSYLRAPEQRIAPRLWRTGAAERGKLGLP